MKLITIIICICFFLSWFIFQPFQVLPTSVLPTSTEMPFKEISLPLDGILITINPKTLLKQIDAVLAYFQLYKTQDPEAIKPGLLSQLGISLEDVEDTLRFLKETISEDINKGTKSRLEDPQFLQNYFRFIQWHPQNQPPTDAQTTEKIKITKYAVFTIDGCRKKTDSFNYALYGLPDDEKGMSPQEAEKHKDHLSRYRYSRRQVLDGIYDKGGAEPLIWVTRQGLEEALMEGTICVNIPGNDKLYFNVDRGNGILYDPMAKCPRDQERYWYFGRVQQPQGHGLDINSQMPIYAGAALAGDIYNLGLGKVMGIFYSDPNSNRKKMIIGVLADTGGAFDSNLYQLDYYLGVLPSKKKFNRIIKTLPEFADVYFFIKKPKAF